MVEEIRATGWLKDKFNPEAKYHVGVIPLAEVPNEVDLSTYLPPVRNQGGINSCVGFGVSGAIGAIAKHLGCYQEPYSPNWVYNGARFLENTLTQNVGCYPEDAYKWLKTVGCLIEPYWPYNPNSLCTTDPNNYKQFSIQYGEFDVIRIDNGVDGIISALADGHCVAIGTPWPPTWSGNTSGILPIISPGLEITSGHMTFLYGYNKLTGYAYDQNSWGLSFGKLGKAQIPMESFETFKTKYWGYDAHYVTFTPKVIPIPTPDPPKPNPNPCKVGNGICKVGNGVNCVLGRKGRFFYMNPK